MLHTGTIITTTILIALAVWVFIVSPPLPKDTGDNQERTDRIEPFGERAITQSLAEEPTEIVSLPVYTKETLAQYDGTDPTLPIYIAFEGAVYDVTEGERFYAPGGSYHFLAGTDGTTLLRIVGGETVREKYSIVGTYEE